MSQMRLLRDAVLGVVFGVAMAGTAVALEVGDAAPPLKIAKWVKGEAVDLKDGVGKKIYVVEFWATWCTPCKAAMPHLTKLQERYRDKGVEIVGVSIDGESTVGSVPQFVRFMGDRIGYALGIDADGQTQKAYMEGVGVRGIPHSFVVDRSGKLVWHSHPDELDRVLGELTSGKFDRDKAKEILAERARIEQRRQKAHPALERYFRVVKRRSGAHAAKEAVSEFMPLIEKDAMMLNMVAWQILTRDDIKLRDKDLALRMARMANDLSDGKDPNVLDTYAKALSENGKPADAARHQSQALDLLPKDDPGRPGFESRLEDYQKAAKKAARNEATGEEDAATKAKQQPAKGNAAGES